MKSLSILFLFCCCISVGQAGFWDWLMFWKKKDKTLPNPQEQWLEVLVAHVAGGDKLDKSVKVNTYNIFNTIRIGTGESTENLREVAAAQFCLFSNVDTLPHTLGNSGVSLSQTFKMFLKTISHLPAKAHRSEFNIGSGDLKTIPERLEIMDSALNPYHPTGYNMLTYFGVDEKEPHKEHYRYSPLYTLEGFHKAYDGWKKQHNTSTPEHEFQFQKLKSGHVTFTGQIFQGTIFNRPLSHNIKYSNDIENQLEYSGKVSFKGLGIFKIKPGPWFRAGIIKDYIENDSELMKPYFGPKGSLKRISTHLIIGYGPSVSVNNQETKKRAPFLKLFRSDIFNLFNNSLFQNIQMESKWLKSDTKSLVYRPQHHMLVLLGTVTDEVESYWT